MTEDNGLKLPPRLRQMLIASIDADKLSVVEIYAIFFVLKHAHTTEELELLIKIIANLFPVLKDYTQMLTETAGNDLIKTITPAINQIILDDPALAIEITRAAQTDGADLSSITTQFPQLSKYLK